MGNRGGQSESSRGCTRKVDLWLPLSLIQIPYQKRGKNSSPFIIKLLYIIDFIKYTKYLERLSGTW